MNKSSIMAYKKYLDAFPGLSTEVKKLLLAWVDRNFTYKKTTKLRINHSYLILILMEMLLIYEI